MIEVKDFKKSDFDDFKVQSGQEYFDNFIGDEQYLKSLEELGTSKTMIIDGWIFMAFGVVSIAANRGQFWGLLSDTKIAPITAQRKRVTVFRIIMQYLEDLNIPRIEAHVHANHYQGHKLLNMLGFVCETPNGMKKFFGNETGHLYARVR